MCVCMWIHSAAKHLFVVFLFWFKQSFSSPPVLDRFQGPVNPLEVFSRPSSRVESSRVSASVDSTESGTCVCLCQWQSVPSCHEEMEKEKKTPSSQVVKLIVEVSYKLNPSFIFSHFPGHPNPRPSTHQLPQWYHFVWCLLFNAKCMPIFFLFLEPPMSSSQSSPLPPRESP